MLRPNDEDDASHYKRSRILPRSSSGVLTERTMQNGHLPTHLLDVICKKLDMDDIYSFGEVCRDWRISYLGFRGQTLASQAPLVVDMKNLSQGIISFYNISDGYSSYTKLPEIEGLSHDELCYIGFSSGYLIMSIWTENSLLLVDPFMRRMKEIPDISIRDIGYLDRFNNVMLACPIDTKDFVIVTLCKALSKLVVYQSRNSSWESYPKLGHSRIVVDVVAFHRTIYALDNTGKIGVLSLNSPRVKFLSFNDTPTLNFRRAKLVSSNGQLLVVDVSPRYNIVQVFKIDFSAMEWVKQETLGERALFFNVKTKCYALSNPGMWGYDSNCVYYMNGKSPVQVYSMDNKIIKSFSNVGIGPAFIPKCVDWYFHHLHDEVDYSLDD